MFTEISVNDINDFRLGHASNKEAGTGVTVIYFPDGATAGCDISGGGPASRETPLTMPMTADNPINAIVLSGGSAYGLAASDGVMTCLEEHGIGYNTGVSLVPLVCQSCIFDLGYGSSKIRPDSAMGYEACMHALRKTGVVNADNSTAAVTTSNSDSSSPVQGCIGLSFHYSSLPSDNGVSVFCLVHKASHNDGNGY